MSYKPALSETAANAPPTIRHDGLERGTPLQCALRYPRIELIPTARAQAHLQHLPCGATVAVTCSPSKGLMPTVELAVELAHRGFAVAPHLAARQVASESQLLKVMEALLGAGVHDVFVVGGDVQQPAGPYRNALDMLRVLKTIHPDLKTGVAAYPEGHPTIDPGALFDDLAAKQDYARYMVTQMCFEAKTTVAYLEQLRARGITLPAYVGIPGVVGTRKLLEVAARLGIGDSYKFLAKHFGSALKLVTGYRPDHLVDGFEAALGDTSLGLAGLHFFSFNQVREFETWRQEQLTVDRNPFVASGGSR